MNPAVAWSVTLGAQSADPLPVTATISGCSPTGSPCANVTAQCRDRVRAALLNSGERWPDAVVELSIPNPPQPGGIADLAVGVAVLAADGTLASMPLGKVMFAAELGLDGSLRSVAGPGRRSIRLRRWASPTRSYRRLCCPSSAGAAELPLSAHPR
ncbi:magnesium chelatase domain-containing protein [Nocardia sp. NPDC051756]|uniref:magnesium chelatase domain-containing protein n=1 Tax=Nocardia sp. NPDC051756 TaxID=3154751 RepID=UPI0034472C78